MPTKEGEKGLPEHLVKYFGEIYVILRQDIDDVFVQKTSSLLMAGC